MRYSFVAWGHILRLLSPPDAGVMFEKYLEQKTLRSPRALRAKSGTDFRGP